MSFYLRPAPVFYGNPCANSAIKYWNKLRIKKSGWKQSVAPGSIYCQAAYIKCASKKKKSAHLLQKTNPGREMKRRVVGGRGEGGGY